MKKMNFSDIPAHCKYTAKHKATISTWHSNIIEWAVSHFDGTDSAKRKLIAAMNYITSCVVSGDSIPDVPIQRIMELAGTADSIEVEQTCGSMYIPYRDVIWDIEPVPTEDEVAAKPIDAAPAVPQMSAPQIPKTVVPQTVSDDPQIPQKTPKEDLFLRPPVIPAFDKRRPWLDKVVGSIHYMIYTTLPEIPTKQREISVTTDVTRMKDTDVLRLFPNCMIRTRSSVMYEPTEGMELHPQLGLLLPIKGFTREQLIDNIVKYPHIYKLKRILNGEFVSFYDYIEIRGKLYKTLEVWDELPESKIMPRSAEFIKEYVVRRYLLERDIEGIEHLYPMLGTMDPFVTLFMPPDDYKEYGYTDAVKLGRDCVKARVSYIQTRNPVIRAVNGA